MKMTNFFKRETNFVIPLVGMKLRRVEFEDIIYFEADTSVCKVYLRNEMITSSKPIKYFLEIIDEEGLEDFYETHRGIIINLLYANTLDWLKSEIKMEGVKIPLKVAKHKRATLKSKMGL